jgi:hypothetical protein
MEKQLEIEQLYYIIGGIKMLEDAHNWEMEAPIFLIIIILLMDKETMALQQQE